MINKMVKASLAWPLVGEMPLRSFGPVVVCSEDVVDIPDHTFLYPGL
jgi:hypothetical protein